MAAFVSNKEFHWLASAFSGIVICKTVYELTGIISHFCFKGYGKLSMAKKVEWNNRGFSTFHAVVAAFASLYLLLLSDIFNEDYNDELIINRTSTVSETMLGVTWDAELWGGLNFVISHFYDATIVAMIKISIGYFLSDLAMILWHYPALGGLEYVLHHGLSMFSILLALVSGQGQIYILMVLFTEVTTPFVNLRWYLEVAGQKSSGIYICNGVALFLGWLVARILLFIYFFVHMAIHFEQVKKIFPLGFYSLLVVPPVLAAMNVFWFWKIVKGLIKTLSKARRSR